MWSKPSLRAFVMLCFYRERSTDNCSHRPRRLLLGHTSPLLDQGNQVNTTGLGFTRTLATAKTSPTREPNVNETSPECLAGSTILQASWTDD
jgi:hypothetical protein